MDCLTDMCFLCLRNNIQVQSMLFQDTDGIVVNEKLRSLFPEIIDSTPDAHKLSCSECLEKLRISYEFKQSVKRNNTIFREYIKKLQCQYKSHQQLARSNYRTNLPWKRDDTGKKVENFDEKHDNESLKIQNENLNPTNQEQLNTRVQSCQINTIENDEYFTEFRCQTVETNTNLKIENIEIDDPLKETEEIYIKQESFVDEDYINEDSKESEDSNSTSRYNVYNDERTNIEAKKKWYNCSECPKAFTLPSNLEAHIRIHTGERPYKCPICQKTFAQSSNLNSHKLTHTGEKPYSCEICQKSFNRKSNLIIHKRSHGNVRPYECPVCKQTFKYTSNLTRHMFTHSVH